MIEELLEWLLEPWDELDTATMPQLAFLVLWKELKNQECRLVGDILLMDFSESSRIPEPERSQIVRHLKSIEFHSIPSYPLNVEAQRAFKAKKNEVKRNGAGTRPVEDGACVDFRKEK